ncbi:AAEL017340-PA [Aedes aegypti]|uniref:AAEL017340-PA n=1 Tax=Aedes aegypti TaxID=7159 RepID=J9HG07_AEDAE|nr:AAEL017340-PA [Aedes aegypti]
MKLNRQWIVHNKAVGKKGSKKNPDVKAYIMGYGQTIKLNFMISSYVLSADMLNISFVSDCT